MKLLIFVQISSSFARYSLKSVKHLGSISDVLIPGIDTLQFLKGNGIYSLIHVGLLLIGSLEGLGMIPRNKGNVSVQALSAPKFATWVRAETYIKLFHVQVLYLSSVLRNTLEW